jgi:hypothetical protein
MTPDWENTLEAMTLVLVRISGLMVFAPVFSSEAIPPRIKAGFVLAVSYLIAPVVAAFPGAHAELGILPVLGELSVGLVFGLTLSFLFEALQFTGQVMGFQFSFSLVNLMDPNAPVQIPLMGQLFGLLGTLTVLGAGLHRTMLAALFQNLRNRTSGDGDARSPGRPGAGDDGWGNLQCGTATVGSGAGGDLAGGARRGAGRQNVAAAAGDGDDRAGQDAAGVWGTDWIARAVAALD